MCAHEGLYLSGEFATRPIDPRGSRLAALLILTDESLRRPGIKKSSLASALRPIQLPFPDSIGQ